VFTRLVAILILPAALAGARERPVVEASWEELAPLVEGRQVESLLVDGVRIKGTVVRVAPDALEIHVTRTSEPGRRKGVRRFPKDRFGLIRVRLYRGPARALLAIAGIVGPLGVTAARYRGGLPESVSSAGLVFTTVGLPVVLGVLGYKLGARLDDRSFDVKIVQPGAGKLGFEYTVTDF
jgi:hypothetical protein